MDYRNGNARDLGRLEEVLEAADDACFRVANVAASYFGPEDEIEPVINDAIRACNIIREITGSSRIIRFTGNSDGPRFEADETRKDPNRIHPRSFHVLAALKKRIGYGAVR